MSPRPKGPYGHYRVDRTPTPCPDCGQICMGTTGLHIHQSLTHGNSSRKKK